MDNRKIHYHSDYVRALLYGFVLKQKEMNKAEIVLFLNRTCNEYNGDIRRIKNRIEIINPKSDDSKKLERVSMTKMIRKRRKYRIE